ncbi:MAG: right-handed parallel beta-helix repeat-containing protein, partial [Candidatus Marinimicrobia bacterium]|nr:right-handed parallel beta-helix repeat-containing protein [Candidatus Neomarinimicrobiota bacterium]
TLFIGSGNYWEYMKVNSSGSSGNPIVIYGDITGERTRQPAGAIGIGNSSKNYAVEIVGKHDIHLFGITFQGPKKSCVYISNSDNVEISYCAMQWQPQYGVYATSAGGYLRVIHNTITDGTYSIYFLNNDVGVLSDILSNTITNSTIGIYTNNTDVDSISNNSISGISNYGIYVRYATTCNSITQNEVYNIWNYYGIYSYRSNCGQINENIIYNIGSRGMYLTSGDVNYTIGTVNNNIIHDIWNEYGIYANKTDVERISGNTIYTINNDGIYYNGNNIFTVGRINNNRIHDCWDDGIYVYRAKDVISISENIIYRTDVAIYWNPSSYYTIERMEDNILHTNRTGGINTKYINNTVITHNLIYGNLYRDSYGIRVDDNNNRTISIVNNTIYNPGKYGIYGKDVVGNWFNNIIVGANTWGIYGDGTFNVDLGYNCLYNNNDNWANKATIGEGSFSQDPLLVDPDGNDNILGGDNWEDDDLHIQSTGYSWHFGTWLPDAADSPCLDTGNPNDDYSNEPEDNGDRINIGCHGNTDEASRIGSSCPITMTYAAFPDSSWMLIGVPVIPEDGDPFAVYGDDFGGEMPDGSNWACYRWTTEDSVSEYYEYADGTDLQPPDCYPGIGHYMWQNTGAPVAVDVIGCPLNEDAVLDVAKAPTVNWEPHPPGYNMFANPFNFTIDWSNSVIIKYENGRSSSTEYTLNEAAIEGIISRYAYFWNYIEGQYEIVTPNPALSDDTLSVWQGFWFVQLDSVNDIELVIPQTRALGKKSKLSNDLAAASSKYNFRTASVAVDWDWFLKLGVVSENRQIQDISNGIGVAESATDATDSWDALDFKGTNFSGDYVQLQFINSDEKAHAYDIHALFTETSEWQMRVTAKADNIGKPFSLVWPEMRLVPETIKFTLYNADKTEVLVPDLRSAVPYYEFSYAEGDNYFTIEASQISDTKSPEFSFIVTQNLYTPQDATIYAIPSEPVTGTSATFDGNSADIKEIISPPYVYYLKTQLAGAGTVQFSISAHDKSGNTGTGTVNVNSGLAKPTEAITIVDESSGVSLEIPQEAVSKNTPIVLTCCEMDLDYDAGLIPVNNPVYIGPKNIYFNKTVSLKIPVNETKISLYCYNGKSWEYVSPYSQSMKISKSGTYQFLSKTITDQENTAVPLHYKLYTAYPNPFNNSTIIRYDIEKLSTVSIIIYDLQGREVRTLTNRKQLPGSYISSWNGNNNNGQPVASGSYIFRLIAQEGKSVLYERNQKITLVK